MNNPQWWINFLLGFFGTFIYVKIAKLTYKYTKAHHRKEWSNLPYTRGDQIFILIMSIVWPIGFPINWLSYTDFFSKDIHPPLDKE